MANGSTRSTITAVATTITALETSRAADAAEETARHSEKTARNSAEAARNSAEAARHAKAQAEEIASQTSILKEKAKYERLISCLDGASDIEKWEIIYHEKEKHFLHSLVQVSTIKLVDLFANPTLFPKIRTGVKKLTDLKNKPASINAKIEEHNLELEKVEIELVKIATIPPSGHKDAKAKGSAIALSSFCVCSFFAFAAFFDKDGIVAGIVMAIIAILSLLYFSGDKRTKTEKINKLKLEISELKSKISELDGRKVEIKQQFTSTLETIDCNEIWEHRDWQVITPDECFECLYGLIKKFQSNIPPRCRLKLTREIAANEVECALKHKDNLLKGGDNSLFQKNDDMIALIQTLQEVNIDEIKKEIDYYGIFYYLRYKIETPSKAIEKL